MTDEELKEILGEMKGDVTNPELCNIPIPDMNQAVRAGTPTVCGDTPRDECVFLSKSFLNFGVTFTLDVIGDSMMDIGIMPGDKLQIKSCPYAEDGDIVVAALDGEFTLKAYFRDEDGQCWLVPANEVYKPIRLTEDMDMRILGKVVKVIKEAPRYSHTSMMQVLRAAQVPVSKPKCTPEPLICEVAPMVHTRRQWIAVYRALVDLRFLKEEMFRTFVEMVTGLVPEHMHLPTVELMRRMNVQCFTKPIDQWHPDKAPVSGYRYEEYLKIALAVKAESGKG